MLSILACWLACASPVRQAAASPHPEQGPGVTAWCVSCHEDARAVLAGPMATRADEVAFARRAFGTAGGDRFFAESCSGCHVTGCADCHGNSRHPAGKPADDACLRCHHGYSAGWEYQGKAPREDHSRFQRGGISQSEHFLKMLPDVHMERGMACADCHAMKSMHSRRAGAKACRDCHDAVTSASPEHAITGHLEKMACVACHAAWAAQECGTFLIRAVTAEQPEAFAPLPQWGPWRKSSHLKRQGPPPLGLDEKGLVAPIRPRYILFVTDLSQGWENRLMAAEWRSFSPHTVRRGSVACGGCHDSPRRFLLEPEGERVHLIDQDGLILESYWNRKGQRLINGSFLPVNRYLRMNRKTPEFARGVVGQWQRLLTPADPRFER